nr:hypothetical protein [Candidatus Frankia alpina]
MIGWFRGCDDLPAGEQLRAAMGSPRPIRRLASSPRSRVWLVELDGSPAVVKQVVGGLDAADRYAREVTALRLAARVRPPVVPTLIGADPHARAGVRARPWCGGRLGRGMGHRTGPPARGDRPRRRARA